MKRFSLLTWVILIFLGIGILVRFIDSPSSIIIPVAVFGTIFYFLKHPEKLRTRNNNRDRYYYANQRKNQKKETKRSFTVIKGNFRDDEEDKHYH